MMGCASSKELIKSVRFDHQQSKDRIVSGITHEADLEETGEEEEDLFDANDEKNHPEEAIRDLKRSKDCVYVFLQQFRQKNTIDDYDEDFPPPSLREYYAELQMRKRTGARKQQSNSNKHSHSESTTMDVGNNEQVETQTTFVGSGVLVDLTDYREEWIGLGKKAFCCGVSGALVPFMTKKNDEFVPMNRAPIWPLPGNAELATAFRLIVFPKDASFLLGDDADVDYAQIDCVDDDDDDDDDDTNNNSSSNNNNNEIDDDDDIINGLNAKMINNLAVKGDAITTTDEKTIEHMLPPKHPNTTTTTTTVAQNEKVEIVKKTFLEETGRASPDAFRNSRNSLDIPHQNAKNNSSIENVRGGNGEDEPPMESLLIDPKLDEIFTENKKTDGSLGCVLFTLRTLLPPLNDNNGTESIALAPTKDVVKIAEEEDSDNNTKNENNSNSVQQQQQQRRRNLGELVVLDSKLCYFDVGYLGIVNTLAAAKFSDCLNCSSSTVNDDDSDTKQPLHSIKDCKQYAKRMRLDSKAIQQYQKAGFLSVSRLKKMLHDSRSTSTRAHRPQSPSNSPRASPIRMSLDFLRNTANRA